MKNRNPDVLAELGFQVDDPDCVACDRCYAKGNRAVKKRRGSGEGTSTFSSRTPRPSTSPAAAESAKSPTQEESSLQKAMQVIQEQNVAIMVLSAKLEAAQEQEKASAAKLQSILPSSRNKDVIGLKQAKRKAGMVWGYVDLLHQDDASRNLIRQEVVALQVAEPFIIAAIKKQKLGKKVQEALRVDPEKAAITKIAAGLTEKKYLLVSGTVQNLPAKNKVAGARDDMQEQMMAPVHWAGEGMCGCCCDPEQFVTNLLVLPTERRNKPDEIVLDLLHVTPQARSANPDAPVFAVIHGADGFESGGVVQVQNVQCSLKIASQVEGCNSVEHTHSMFFALLNETKKLVKSALEQVDLAFQEMHNKVYDFMGRKMTCKTFSSEDGKGYANACGVQGHASISGTCASCNCTTTSRKQASVYIDFKFVFINNKLTRFVLSWFAWVSALLPKFGVMKIRIVTTPTRRPAFVTRYIAKHLLPSGRMMQQVAHGRM